MKSTDPGQKKPAGHNSHDWLNSSVNGVVLLSIEVVLVLPLLYFPELQGVCPPVVEHEYPAMQDEQAVALGGELSPAGHSVQAVTPSSAKLLEKVPKEQSLQSPLSSW